MRELHFGRRTRPIIAPLRHAAMPIDVIADIFGLQQFRHFSQGQQLFNQRQLAGFGRGTIGIHKTASHGRTIFMRRTAKFLTLTNRKIRITAHDRAHLNGTIFPLSRLIFNRHQGRTAFAAHALAFFVNDIIRVAIFLQIHRCRGPCRATANDTNPLILVWFYRLHRVLSLYL